MQSLFCPQRLDTAVWETVLRFPNGCEEATKNNIITPSDSPAGWPLYRLYLVVFHKRDTSNRTDQLRGFFVCLAFTEKLRESPRFQSWDESDSVVENAQRFWLGTFVFWGLTDPQTVSIPTL